MLEYFKKKLGEKLSVRQLPLYIYQVEPVSVAAEHVTFDVFFVSRSDILIYGKDSIYSYLGVKTLHPSEFEEGAYETLIKVAEAIQISKVTEKEKNGE
jgi:hypothetical protein